MAKRGAASGGRGPGSRLVEDAAGRSLEARTFGWPDLLQDPGEEQAAEDEAAARAEEIAEELDARDIEDRAVDPLALEPGRIREAGRSEPRAPWHGDPLEERRRRMPQHSIWVSDGRAAYLREDADPEQRQRVVREICGRWRRRAAVQALAEGVEAVRALRGPFLARRPNPDLVAYYRESVGRPPEWYRALYAAEGPQVGTGWVVFRPERVRGRYESEAEAKREAHPGDILRRFRGSKAAGRPAGWIVYEREASVSRVFGTQEAARRQAGPGDQVRAVPREIPRDIVSGWVVVTPEVLRGGAHATETAARAAARPGERVEHRAGRAVDTEEPITGWVVVERPRRVSQQIYFDAKEARDAASEGDKVAAVDVKLPEARESLERRLLREAEPPYLHVTLRQVHFDPAVLSVLLGMHERVPGHRGYPDPGDHARRLLDRRESDHRALCRRDPAASQDVERGWNADRRAIAQRVLSGGGPVEQGLTLLRAVHDHAESHWAWCEVTRFRSRAHSAVGLDPARQQAAPDKLALIDEAYPNLNRAIEVLDAASPLAVRPAGAGARFDRAMAAAIDGVRSLSLAAGARPSAADAELAVFEAVRALDGRLGGTGRMPGSPPEWPLDGLADQVPAPAQCVAETIGALAERGRAVRFAADAARPELVDPPRGGMELRLPASWSVAAADGEVIVHVTSSEALVDGRLRLAPLSEDDCRDFFREVGFALEETLRPFEPSLDPSPSPAEAEAAKAVAAADRFYNRYPRDAAVYYGRQVEHFAELMTARACSREIRELPGDADGAWVAPGRTLAQSDRVDELLARRAGVDAQRIGALVPEVRAAVRDSERQRRDLVDRLQTVLEAAETAGLRVDGPAGGQVGYVADARPAKAQRDARAGGPEDRLVVPARAADAAQPRSRLTELHRQVYEALWLASGHPHRRDRETAGAVAAVQPAGRACTVESLRLVADHPGADAHRAAYPRERELASRFAEARLAEAAAPNTRGSCPSSGDGLDKRDRMALKRADTWLGRALAEADAGDPPAPAGPPSRGGGVPDRAAPASGRTTGPEPEQGPELSR